MLTLIYIRCQSQSLWVERDIDSIKYWWAELYANNLLYVVFGRLLILDIFVSQMSTAMHLSGRLVRSDNNDEN